MGFGEMFFLVLLALIVFGPKRLPEMARKLGKIVGEFRRASNDFRAQIEDEVRKLEVTETAKSMGAELKQATQSISRFSFDEQPATPAARDVAPQILPPINTNLDAHTSDLQRDNSFDAAEQPPEPTEPAPTERHGQHA